MCDFPHVLTHVCLGGSMLFTLLIKNDVCMCLCMCMGLYICMQAHTYTWKFMSFILSLTVPIFRKGRWFGV